MTFSNDQVKVRVSRALRERNTRVACLIFESIRTALDLLDEQSPVVIEALIEHTKDVQRTGYGVLKGPRHDVRQALIRYGEAVLEEARARERRLLEGITGEPDA